MYLVQLLLPLYDNDGTPLPARLYGQVRAELTERFGGVTAYMQAPASGLWQQEEGKVVRDELVVHEVMAEVLDTDWWRSYRKQLEARFKQEVVVIRAQSIRML